jgi:hypothetical protein
MENGEWRMENGERENGRTGERENGRTGERENGRTGGRENGRTGERNLNEDSPSVVESFLTF